MPDITTMQKPGSLKRTVYYEITRGCVRWYDWAKVDYGQHTYWEPFNWANVTMQGGYGKSFADADFEEDLSAVHEIQLCNFDTVHLGMADTTIDPPIHLHGGNLLTRAGR